ncbi:MAG: hypoxanthine phosphoribosyltransferase [Planctomycetota bacterium]|nr:hypoxanthine phosphoribosyltransferase [Planctomycetota bacterium]MDA1105695.1 hypoxanthine phosphoribosyltransferase [Planctomycetota bacterium]
MSIQGQVGECVVDADRIRTRVRELAEEIHRAHPSGDDPLVVIVVLAGAVIFAADLIRALPHRVIMAFVKVSSYPGTSTTSQGIVESGSMPDAVRARDVLVIDDVLDTGRTLQHLRAELQSAGARTVRTCVLLRKDRAEAKAVPCDHVGFDIPDRFVVGYGLDYNDEFRHLPDIRLFTLGPDA